MNKIKTTTIIVLGAGESGVGSAILAQKKGFSVFVSDFGKIEKKYRKELVGRHILFEENTHDYITSILNNSNTNFEAIEVVKSPGIPDNAPIVKLIKERKINIISEIEFAGRYTDAKTICITGSNGKTTTTMLTYFILKNGGLNVGLAGNVGQSFAWQVADCNYDYYVLELSSFQLDGMYDFKADIAIITNITPDHLDRYSYDFQNYIDSKFRILQNQTEEDSFIFWSDDAVVKKEIAKRNIKSSLMPFGETKNAIEGDQTLPNRAFLCDNNIYMTDEPNNISWNMQCDNLALKGKHNQYNSMAAALVGNLAGVEKQSIRKSLETFDGVEHRMEYVATVRGVSYINDSKATNVNSCWYALQSMQRPVVLILGGTDKGNEYEELVPLIADKVHTLIFLGADNSKLISFFSNHTNKNIINIPYFEACSMAECVKRAYDVAEKDDVVLLSPCCASFDLFSNYEDRGRQFKEQVLRL